MSYDNPIIPMIDSPIGLDKVIQALQLDLAALPWLDKSFGRAWNFGGDPKAYNGEGEYISVAPNDNVASQSFIAVSGDEETVDYEVGSPTLTLQRDLNIIFWMNLNRIDENAQYIFTEVLKDEVQKILKRSPWVASINFFADEDVFDGYKVQQQMYPFAGFRINVTVNYMEEC